MPTLSSTPTSSTPAPIGASAPASGSQVCNGTSGALIANATKKPRNSQIWVLSGISGTIVRSVAQLNVPPAGRYSALTTYSPISDASMIRPPNREYRKNFTAAYCRRGPPKRPMRKYIGISMASKNT